MKTYLQQIAGKLRLPENQIHQIIQEVQTHLDQTVQQLMLSGLSRQQSEQQAIQEFGKPQEVAKRFNQVHKQWFNSVRRIIIGLGAVLILRYILQLLLFSALAATYLSLESFNVLAELNDTSEILLYIGLAYMVFTRVKLLANNQSTLIKMLLKITASATLINSTIPLSIVLLSLVFADVPLTLLTGGLRMTVGYGLAVGVIFSLVFATLLVYQHYYQSPIIEE